MAEEFPFRYVQPVDPNIGRRVDLTFIIRELIARGGMGGAYLAEHELMSHVKCVIKLVLADLANQPAVMARWSNETSAVSRLKHDNIVRLHNFGWLDDGQPFMRFEYIEGQSLHKYLAARGGRLPIRDALYIFFQVCDALAYAHALDVVHRDLKPDNLMIELDPPGAQLPIRVKVLDFGIAKILSAGEQTGAGVVMGTPGFMAPEQATNAAAATGKADVFALAVVLYRAVTGMMPWGPVESDLAIYYKQRTEPPAAPPASLMPPAVTAVVLRALSLSPETRPTMREFAQLLAAAVPADGHLRSGIDILREVKRSWADSSPPNGLTMPRPIADLEGEPPALPHENVASEIVQVPENAAPNDIGPANEAALPIAPVPPAEAAHAGEQPEQRAAAGASASSMAEPKRRSSRSDLVITANGRRRPAAAVAAADLSTFKPTSEPGSAPSARGSAPAQPTLADLPTGSFLLSQRFAAQEAPSGADIREPSVIVAHEFEAAIGTPPGPYGASHLPAVVISNTLLTGAASKTNPNVSPTPEQPPILVLPRAPGRRLPRTAIGVAASLCVAAIASFAVARHHANVENRDAVLIPDTAVPASADERAATDAIRLEKSRPSVASPGTEARSATAEANGHPAELTGAQPEFHEAVGAQVASAPSHAPNVASSDRGANGANPAQATGHPAAAPPTHVPTTPPGGNTSKPLPSATPSERESLRTSIPAAPPPPSGATSSPQQANKKTGTLKVFVTPWAMVSLDGKSLDQTPVLEDISVGRHRLRLTNKVVGKDETTVITINSGLTTTIERTW